MDLGEIGWVAGIDWIGLAQDKDKWRVLVDALMNLWIPYIAGRFLSGLSSSAQLHIVSDTTKWQ
jgi:hypothetical protein